MSNYYPNPRYQRPTPPPQPITFICRITGPIPTNSAPGGADTVLGVADGPNGGPNGCPGKRPVTFLCRIFGPVGGPGDPGGSGGGPGPRFEQEEEFSLGQFPGEVLGFSGPVTEGFQGGGPGPRLPVPGLYTLQVLAPVNETNGPGGGPGGPGGGPGGPGGRPGTSPISCNYCFFNDVEL